MHTHRTVDLLAISALVTVTATVMAASVIADPVSTLAQAVQSLRSGSQCPPLQSDPLVQRVTEMATQNTSDWINHHNVEVPFTDPMPALKGIGYTAGSKAVLLSGYGANEADAIHGLILQGLKPIPDCSYTQYGVNAMRDDAGFNLTSVVLAGK
ncbi:hypothetical protein JF780_26595 [Mycobacterium intracellulare]|uniref:hypothetical protein n=1 Tax=Mycobacterium intracellulare TaxID=1767 RepID=UPI001CD96A1F|nr:hypothetical protein [Mycobacterium intracellulare]MCA2276889.1 hypothetical protein [Mycobacterium intracellulare]MCA2328533.1 hypothetical protein [Mycobacterium intracellulare]